MIKIVVVESTSQGAVNNDVDGAGRRDGSTHQLAEAGKVPRRDHGAFDTSC